MFQLKTGNNIRNRILFVFLFMTILHGVVGYANGRGGELPSDSHTTCPGEELSSCSQTAHRYQELALYTRKSSHHQNLSFRSQTAHRHHFDLKPSHYFIHLPHTLMEDIPEDLTEDQVAFIFRAHEPRHKRRFYISVTNQQYSFTTRLQQLQLLLAQYIPEDEDKTGIYQWHDAFLPAYYKFLFRYTLF